MRFAQVAHVSQVTDAMRDQSIREVSVRIFIFVGASISAATASAAHRFVRHQLLKGFLVALIKLVARFNQAIDLIPNRRIKSMLPECGYPDRISGPSSFDATGGSAM
jgi:hypothetical protein